MQRPRASDIFLSKKSSALSSSLNLKNLLLVNEFRLVDNPNDLSTSNRRKKIDFKKEDNNLVSNRNTEYLE